MNQEVEVPSYFLCPISLQIMKDPVTVSTGITYDRETIEKWIFANKSNPTCPVTKQALDDVDCLTPNHTLRRLIQSWCTLNAIERFPTPKPPVTRAQVCKIVSEATRCPHNMLKCLKQLRGIAAESTANKRCLEGAGVVEFLARVVVSNDDSSRNVVDEAISTLCQLHISEEQAKKMILERNGAVFGSLARASVEGSYEARANAVELMKLLLQVAEPAQVVSFKKEYFTSLVYVLSNKNGDIPPRMIKSCLKILNLVCPWGRNRIRAVEAGVVPILIDFLLGTEERRFTETVLAVLDHLCGCAEGRAELLGHGAGLAVVSKKILRVSAFATERAVRILASISRFATGNGVVVQEMVEVGVVLKLCLVLQVNCDTKTKERAREILKLHAKAWGNSPCAPSHVFASLN